MFNWKKVLFICLAVQILMQATIVECTPGRRYKSGSKTRTMAGALAGGLAGLAVGSLLRNNNQPRIKNHYHYLNPPPYSYAPVAVQSVPVVMQQPVVPVYTQQQPVATVYQQQQQPVAPVYQQQQQPIAPVYQQQPAAPVAPVAVAVNPGNQSHPVSPIVYATNQSHPVSPMVPVVNTTSYVSSAVTAANQTHPVYLAPPAGNHSYPVTPMVSVTVAPVAQMAPVVTQQYAPVAPVVAQPPMVQMVPVAAQQPNVGTAQVFVLSKKTGHYGRNSADNLRRSSCIALMLLSVVVYFI